MYNQGKYFSAREVAMLGVPYHQVTNACQSGELPCQRMGPAFSIAEADAVAWVTSYKQRMDPNGVFGLKEYIKKLEAEITQLRAQVKQLGGAV